jgi:DMSO/TMAO reductase YedYZ molybdopterin-dependent catalytic subunit
MSAREHDPAVGPVRRRLRDRRTFLLDVAAGTVVAVLGGLYTVVATTADDEEEKRPDGRARIPPGQKVIQRLRPMGGREGDPSASKWTLKIHGEVEKPYEIGFADLLEQPQVEKKLDVHCVTRWTVLGALWKGVRVKHLVEKAGVKPKAKHVIFEAAHGYTTNVRLDEALAEDNLVAWRLDGHPLPRSHGGPVRAVVPDLYFWKSAKWLTGIKLVEKDEKGYWERRGYNNHADPWKEERYA